MKNEKSGRKTRVSLVAIPAALCSLIPVLAPGWRTALAQSVYGPTPEQEALLSISTTPAQRAIGSVVGAICPQGIATPDLQRDCDALLRDANSQDPAVRAAAANAIGSLTPDQAGVPVNAAQNSVGVQAQNVTARLVALRGGATRISGRGLGLNNDGWPMSPEQFAGLASSGGAASADSSAEFGRLGVFINGTFRFGDKNPTSNEAGFDFDTQGVTAGADYRLTDRLVLGGAVGYVHANNDLDANGGKLDTNGYSFTLYGTYYHTDRFYVDGSASYGRNDYDQSRNIRYVLTGADVAQTLSAGFDGDQWDLSLGTGYELSNGPWTYGPLSRLEYIEVNVDGFRESASNPGTDGSGWTVAVNSQTFRSLTLNLGVQTTYAMSLPWGVLLPQARFEWVHEFKGDSGLVTGRFVGDPSRTPFQFATDAADSNYFTLGVGASAVFARGRSAFLYYQSVLGYEDLTDNTFNVGVRMEF